MSEEPEPKLERGPALGRGLDGLTAYVCNEIDRGALPRGIRFLDVINAHLMREANKDKFPPDTPFTAFFNQADLETIRERDAEKESEERESDDYSSGLVSFCPYYIY
jgi:hypothetical protein